MRTLEEVPSPKTDTPHQLTTEEVRKIIREEIDAALVTADFASNTRVIEIERDNHKLSQRVEAAEARAAVAAQTAVDTAQKLEALVNKIDSFGSILETSQRNIEALFKAYLPRIDDLSQSVERLEDRDDKLQEGISANTLQFTKAMELTNANLAQATNAITLNTKMIFGDKDLPNAQKSIIQVLNELSASNAGMIRALDRIGQHVDTMNADLVALKTDFTNYKTKWLRILKAGGQFIVGRYSKAQAAGLGAGGVLLGALLTFIKDNLL